MPSPDPEPIPPSDPDAGARDSSPPGVVGGGPARPHALWGWALAAGVLGGLAAWLGGELTYGAFDVTPVGTSSIEVARRYALLQEAGDIKNAAAAFGILGAASGLALGLAGGLARGSARAALAAAVAGLALGGAAGWGIALVLARVYYQNHDPNSNDLLLLLLVHGGIGSAIGLAGGLAFGIGLGGGGRTLRAALGGLLGAIAGTMFIEVVGALAFPMAKAHRPISEEAGARLLACLALAVFVAAGAAFGARDPGAKRVPK
jgi:hypothetical protein